MYYIDASIQIDVARALSLVRKDILYPGGPGCVVTDTNIHDDVWLPIAGENNWIVVFRDKRIRTRTWERQKLVHHGVRAFCLTHAGNYTKWQTLELLVKRWQDIELTAMVNPGPYIYSVTQAIMKELAMPGSAEP